MIRQCAMRWKSALFLAAMLGASALPAYDRAALMPDDPFLLVRISSVSGVKSVPTANMFFISKDNSRFAFEIKGVLDDSLLQLNR